MNIWQTLKRSFKNNLSRPSICDRDGNYLSYGELITKTENIASCLANYQEQRIGVLHTGFYDSALAILACLAAGKTVVPMSLQQGERRCIDIIENCDIEQAFAIEEELPDSIKRLIDDKKMKLINAKELHREGKAQPLPNENKLAFIIHTSGTTGAPKGVMLSHHNVYSNLQGINDYFKVNEKDHFLIVRPPYLHRSPHWRTSVWADEGSKNFILRYYVFTLKDVEND